VDEGFGVGCGEGVFLWGNVGKGFSEGGGRDFGIWGNLGKGVGIERKGRVEGFCF